MVSLLFLVSQAYLLPAGRLWASGMNPYGPAFASSYVEYFGAGPASHFWVYPPNWWGLSALLGLLEFQTALQIWNLTNYICIIAGSALIASTVDEDAWKTRLLCFFNKRNIHRYNARYLPWLKALRVEATAPPQWAMVGLPKVAAASFYFETAV